MSDMLHQRQQLKPPVAQAKQNADADIVDARLHRPIHRRDTPVIISLLASQMHPAVGPDTSRY